jgi:hypothetical protein
VADTEAAVQRMIAEACFGKGSLEELTADLRGFLSRHGLPAEDVEAIVASRLAPGRLALYRRLIRNNLVGVTSRMMPRTRARLDAVTEGAFDAAMDDFLATIGPRTHYLRDVPVEFLAWAAPRWSSRADVPAYLPDLAAHELAHFQIAALPTPPERPPLGELAIERPLVFAEAQRIMRYRFAVHELPDDPDDRSEPVARPVVVLVYRDEAFAIGTMELEPLMARVLERLQEKLPLGEAIAAASRETGAALTNEILAEAAELHAELGREGVLLGAQG